MTDQSTSPTGSSNHSRPKGGFAARLSILGAVCILYLVFVGAVFLGFSGYILRINLERDLSAQGGIDELLFSITQEATLETDLGIANESVSMKLSEIAIKNAETQKLGAEYWLKDAARNSVFMPISLLISRNSNLFNPEFVDNFHGALSSNEVDLERSKKLTAMIAAPIFLRDANDEQVDRIIESFKKSIATISALNIDFETTSSSGEIAGAELEQQQEQLVELKEYRDSIALKLKTLRESDIYANKSRVMSFEPLLWGTFFSLIQVPTIILTLIVTIAAGGLGSVVSFTRDLLVETERVGTILLFVSVGEGVAAAVAIFFLAGAGMLMFSTGGSGGGAEISPYMVAFLAFVSGFMAEDAFKSIQRAGEKLFSGGDDN